ncbi:hypothetical protein [Flavobacterium laiguense]|uniref:Uncharacterized protein n=1 Tax=Flavobacterium laiguense TaxID=2169409 RepID=A0A2U1JR63_9FLAO|nr:hypothetical protein [Flavobacterium laiguense]PWA07677.1 hypothetical protein DB891_14350 [Flavobacterium laiguense]
MYKHKNKTRLAESKRPILWIKRKIILIITALMLGMSNGMNAENKMINGNQNHTEQQKKD